MAPTNLKNFALGGFIGPLIFTMAVIINGSQRSDYNHVSQFISELGATGTSNAMWMNLSGFLPFGLSMVAFAISLLFLLPKSNSFRLGSLLILVFGLGVILAGVFSCDAGCPQEGSTGNTIHNQVSAVAFFSAIMGCGILGFSFRKHDDWKSLWIYSVFTCLISAGFLTAMIDSFEASTHNGMWQRLLLLTLFIWFGFTGFRLYRLHKS